MYRITITSPVNQKVCVTIDGELINSHIAISGTPYEVLIDEKSVIDSKQIFIETSDEILDITDHAKKEVLTHSSNKPIIKYGNSTKISTDFGRGSLK